MFTPALRLNEIDALHAASMLGRAGIGNIVLPHEGQDAIALQKPSHLEFAQAFLRAHFGQEGQLVTLPRWIH